LDLEAVWAARTGKGSSRNALTYPNLNFDCLASNDFDTARACSVNIGGVTADADNAIACRTHVHLGAAALEI
jgi:hypothetical protein